MLFIGPLSIAMLDFHHGNLPGIFIAAADAEKMFPLASVQPNITDSVQPNITDYCLQFMMVESSVLINIDSICSVLLNQYFHFIDQFPFSFPF